MMTEKDTMQVKPEKKEDRRVRRTKKLLTHGLIQLMKEKQVQDITVRELADLVDVNRGTFYLYYRDIFDMLDSIEQELFNQVNQLIAAHKGETVLTHTLPVLKELFHLVEENKELCQVLLGQNGDMKFLKKLSDVVQEAFRREWLMMKKDEVTFDYSYAFANAEIALFEGAKGAEIEFAAEKNADKQKLAARYAAENSDPVNAAKNGYVDNIIEPQFVKQYLIASLQMLLK